MSCPIQSGRCAIHKAYHLDQGISISAEFCPTHCIYHPMPVHATALFNGCIFSKTFLCPSHPWPMFRFGRCANKLLHPWNKSTWIFFNIIYCTQSMHTFNLLHKDLPNILCILLRYTCKKSSRGYWLLDNKPQRFHCWCAKPPWNILPRF